MVDIGLFRTVGHNEGTKNDDPDARADEWDLSPINDDFGALGPTLIECATISCEFGLFISGNPQFNFREHLVPRAQHALQVLCTRSDGD